MTAALPTTSEILIKVRRRHGRRCLLAMSRGKDSIAAAIALRDADFEVVPFYTYIVPPAPDGSLLSFEESSLAYYERALFDGRRIWRLPSPSLWTMLRSANFASPERVAVLQAASLGEFGYGDLHAALRRIEGLREDAPVAVGVRGADSPQRRLHMLKTGGIDGRTKQFFPIAAWRKADVIGAIERAGIRLPPDYQVWRRTFDGLDGAFLVGLRKHFPADFERVRQWFPLADAELLRWHEEVPNAPPSPL